MKTIREEVKRVEVITKYEAVDGTVFTTEEECKKYEETAKCAINWKISNSFGRKVNSYGLIDGSFNMWDLPYVGSMCGDDTLFGLEIKNTQDLEALIMYLKCNTSISDELIAEEITPDLIGKKVIINEAYDDENLQVIEKDKFFEALDKFFDWKCGPIKKCSDCKYYAEADAEHKCPKTHATLSSGSFASMYCYEPKTTLTLAQQRCQDCACLVLDDDGNWCCDEEDGAEIEDITCPEGLGRLSCYTEKEDK